MHRHLLLRLGLGFVLCLPLTARAQPLPGTETWENRGDPAADMVSGLHRFLDRELAASVAPGAGLAHRQ